MRYPKFDYRDLGKGLFEVTVEEKGTHQVFVESKGGGNFTFLVGKAGMMQSCYGHPVTDRQGIDVPPAVVISIVKGPKGLNIPWSTYWRGSYTLALLSLW